MNAWFALLIRRRWLVVILALAGAVGGIVNLEGLSIDAVPDVSPKQVMVLTLSPGLGPLEVERLVSFPVENAMAGAPGLSGIRSTSRYGVSAVYVTFDDAMSITEARSQVFQRLPLAKTMMPAGVGDPEMGPMATGLGEIYQFEVRGPGYSPMALKRILQWTIAPKLKLTPGIADVNVYGGQMPTYEVRIAAESLHRYGVTMAQVYTALSENNAARGGAYIEHNDQQEVIRGLGLAKDTKDLANIVVTTGPGGVPVTVATLGEVVEAPKVRLGAVTHDAAGETVVGIAMMQQGENASAVVVAVKQTIEALRPQLPPGVDIVPYYDRSTLVARTIRTVEHNLMEGAVLVIVVLLLLLGNLRAGLVVAAAIPLSMLMAFAGMRLFGLSGNLMSLGAIDFGLIVDGAVVMIENVLRARGEHPERPAEEVIRKATVEVARPILFAVAIIIMVYLPILALEGVAGKMFRPMALTVILALAGSLVLTMTLMPALAAIVLAGPGIGERETRLVHWARSAYTPVLRLAERRTGITVLVTFGLFAGSCWLATRLGGEFLPKLSEGSIVITSEKLPGINLDASLKVMHRIEQTLKSFPEVKRVVSLTGSAEIPTDPMGVESTDSFITLADPSTWTTADTQEGLVAALDKRLRAEVPGVSYAFSQPIQMRMDDLLEGVRGDVAISLYGDDLKVLEGQGGRHRARGLRRLGGGRREGRGAGRHAGALDPGRPGRGRPLRHQRQRRPRRGREHRRPHRRDDLRRRQLHHRHRGPVEVRRPQRHRAHPRPARGAQWQGAGAALAGRLGRRCDGPGPDQPREAPAPDLGPGQRPRPRRPELRDGRAGRGPGAGSPAAALLPAMERAVPEPSGGDKPPLRRGAGGHGRDPRAPRGHVRRHPAGWPDLPERARRRDRRHRRPVPARAAVLDLGGDRIHRHLRHRHPQRRGADELHPRPRTRRPRPARGGDPGRRDAPAAGPDDGAGCGPRLPADGALHERGRRGATTARYRGHRRPRHRDAPDAGGPARRLSVPGAYPASLASSR